MHEVTRLEITAARGCDNLVASDATLVAETLRGSSHCYDLLVRRYERSARATCFAIVRDWHAAEDAAQDAFISAYTNLRTLRDAGSFGTWLLTIARRCATRVAQDKRRRKSLDRGLETAGRPDAGASESSGTAGLEWLLHLLAAIPEHERTVMMLRYVECQDVASIARICGRPVGTITKQLSRAQKRLQVLFAKGQRR